MLKEIVHVVSHLVLIPQVRPPLNANNSWGHAHGQKPELYPTRVEGEDALHDVLVLLFTPV